VTARKKTGRPALSKSVRFEVFKRDRFACTYCGAKAPDVVLVVDHIEPVAKGGSSDILNLATACQPCNAGKGARPLSDESALAKKRDQLAELQERRDQLEMMMEWQRGLVSLDAGAVAQLVRFYSDLAPGWTMAEDYHRNIRAALVETPLARACEIFREQAAKWVRIENGKATKESAQSFQDNAVRALRYEAVNRKDPEGSKLRYIRGIVKNRSNYWSFAKANDCLTILQAHAARGVSTDELQAIAVRATSWSQWLELMDDLVAESQAPEAK